MGNLSNDDEDDELNQDFNHLDINMNDLEYKFQNKNAFACNSYKLYHEWNHCLYYESTNRLLWTMNMIMSPNLIQFLSNQNNSNNNNNNIKDNNSNNDNNNDTKVNIAYELRNFDVHQNGGSNANMIDVLLNYNPKSVISNQLS